MGGYFSNEISHLLLIKGYIPSSLIKIIEEQLNSYSMAKEIVIKCIKKYQDNIIDIWKKRCEYMITLEKRMNIKRKDKRNNKDRIKAETYKEKKNKYPITNHNFDTTSVNRWLYKSIIFGNSYKDFGLPHNIFVMRLI